MSRNTNTEKRTPRTPQIVEWVEDEGIYPINFFEEEKLKKTQEYKEVIAAKPKFVLYENGVLSPIFF